MKDKIKGTLLVPVGLALVLAPYSILIGWNLLTLVLFWLVVVPIFSIFLPRLTSNHTALIFKSQLGLAIFYASMVFMIYDHIGSDYFLIMALSFAINLCIVFTALKWNRLTHQYQ